MGEIADISQALQLLFVSRKISLWVWVGWIIVQKILKLYTQSQGFSTKLWMTLQVMKASQKATIEHTKH